MDNVPLPENSPAILPRGNSRPPGALGRSSDRRRVFGEAIEGAVPAALMAVALSDGLELGLMKRHLRLALVLGEGDRDQGLMAPAAVLAVPGEGVDQALGFDDFAKHAALPKLAAAVVLAQAPPPCAAGPGVLLEACRGEAARTHPVLCVRRVGPKLPYQLARRIEHAGDDEHPLFRLHDGRASACVAYGHASSPWFAACAGNRRGGRSSAPRIGGSARPSRRPLSIDRPRAGRAAVAP